jgi:hypothetical protein
MAIVAGKSENVALFMVTVKFSGYQKNGNRQNGDCGYKQSKKRNPKQTHVKSW